MAAQTNQKVKTKLELKKLIKQQQFKGHKQ
jgi:hypothetical protein